MSAYLNGQYMALEDAKVSVLDRGFLFGDGVYEMIPVYGTQLFRLDEHLLRLERSLAEVRIQNPHTRAEWEHILNTILSYTTYEHDASVYLQVTRGVAARDHAFPSDISPTVFAMANPLPQVCLDEIKQGVSAITLEDYRWLRCDIKAIALLANVVLRQQAVEQGAMEAILIRDGYATEGAATNLFIVANDCVITPPEGPHLLPGITRKFILELLHDNHIPFKEESISQLLLRNADEIWVTSSTKEVVAVTRLDGLTVGLGHAGPVWESVYSIFQEYKEHLRNRLNSMQA